jgi:hypothetical protein
MFFVTPRALSARSAVLATGIFALAACASLLGVEELPRRDPTVGRCGAFRYADAACADCMDGAVDGVGCCAEAAACREDAGCAAYFDCVSPCRADDAGCRAACAQQSPEALASGGRARKLSACRTRACTGVCTDCGALVDPWGPDCASCVAASCCDEATACAQTSCAGVADCVLHCTSPYCADACITDVTTIAVELSNCSHQTPCVVACDIGRHLACAGGYALPTPVPPYLADVTLRIATNDGEPRSGIVVGECTDTTDTSCSRNTAPPTAEDGVAVVSIALAPNSGFGNFFLARDPEGKMIDTLIAIFPNVVRSYSLYVPTFAVSEARAIGALVGVPVDLGLGALYLNALDCVGDASPGLTFTVMAEGSRQTVYYSNAATNSFDLEMTDGTGAAGVINVPPGSASIETRVAATGQLVAASAVPVRAGTVTLAQIRPMPAP